MTAIGACAIVLSACAASRPAPAGGDGATGVDAAAALATLGGFERPSAMLQRLSRGASVAPRAASDGSGPLYRTGDEYDPALPLNHALYGFSVVQLVPQWSAGSSLGDAAYCGYRFDLTGFAGDLNLAYSWAAPPAKSGLVFLGAANFERDAWEWHAAPTNAMVSLASIAPYRAEPDGTMLVIVVALGTEQMDLANIRIGNIPPVASFTMDTGLGIPGEIVHFDGTASSDTDGAIAKYEWDPEGDGTYIPVFLGNGSPTRTVTYSQPGDYSPTLRVTDDSGVAVTASKLMLVTLGNKYSGTLDYDLDAGIDVSMALVNGSPAVAYMWASELRYMYALAPEALNWSAVQVVDPISGGFPDLAVVGGRPAIAFQSGGADLGYVRANNASGSSWPTPKIAVYKYDVSIGFYPALAEVGGLPGIAYGDSEMGWGGTTWYVRADDANGASWQAEHHLSAGGAQTSTPSLALIGGVPMVSFVVASGIEPYMLECDLAQDALGDVWNVPVVALDTGGPNANRESLVAAAGKAALGYFDQADGTLKFVRAAQVDGSLWNAPVAIELTPDTSSAHAFAVINGLPCCAYAHGDAGLCYVIAKNSIGSSWNEPISVEPAVHAQQVALIEVNGLPAIAYFNGTTRHLEFTIYR